MNLFHVEEIDKIKKQLWYKPYKKTRRKNKSVVVHRMIVESIIGRPLKSNEVVHHIDEDTYNNAPSNLLVCDRTYHKLIHRRLRAYNATGNPNLIKCSYCQQWKEPSEMAYPKSGCGGCMKCHSKISNEGRARRQLASKQQAQSS